MSKPWKRRLYDAYVSTGCGGGDSNSDISERMSKDRFRPGNVAAFVNRRIQANRGLRILDLGCGYGALLHFLQRKGYQNLSGIDTSAEQVAVAHRAGMPFVILGDIERHLESMPDASVDLILLIDILEHMEPEEMFRVLDGVHRVLAEGGKCIVHVPNGGGIGGMEIRYGDFTHELAFTRTSATQVFLATGFRAVACFEDPPIVRGLAGLVRRIIWSAGVMPLRILAIAETGRKRGHIFTRNIYVEACK